MWTTKTTQIIIKTTGCSPKLTVKFIAEDKPTHVIEGEEVKLVSIEFLNSYILVYLVQKSSLHITIIVV